jgi:hypothetical protein
VTRHRLPGAVLALAAGALAAAALGLLPGLRGRYRASVPALAVAYRAREACACLFVDGRPEADCVEWTRASPDVARLEIDRGGRTVTARALLVWSARARFEGARLGCRLE